MTKKFNLTDFCKYNCSILELGGRRTESICKKSCEFGSGIDLYRWIEGNHYTFDPAKGDIVEPREKETAYQFFKRLGENKINIIPC